jgi:hypothetical protein
MARKPSDVIQYKIRIREDLRRRLEQAAKKQDVSINYEMTSRLKDSFQHEGRLDQERLNADMEINWARWGKTLFDKEQCGNLVQAAEVLVALLTKPAPEREAVESATAQVQKAITAIKAHAEASARGPIGGSQ